MMGIILRYIRWLSGVSLSNYIVSLITIAAASALFVIVVSGSNLRSDEMAVLLIFTAIMLIFTIVIRHFRVREANIAARLDNIVRILSAEPLRAERAKELYISSEYYRTRANYNNYSSIMVLFVLMVFVGFAGYFLNKDTVQFDAVQRLEALRDQSRMYLGVEKPEDRENYKEMQQLYSNALKQQLDSEAAINQPLYRLSSSFVIRLSVVAVAIYLVIILNRSYRYNNKLSAVYRSRFISTLRGDEQIEEYTKYAMLLSMETIDYDADIDHPADKMLSLFDKIRDLFKPVDKKPQE